MSVKLLEAPSVPKKRTQEQDVPEEDAKVQLSFRAAKSLKARILKCAKALGVDDESTLIRMLITKFLPVFEEQAKLISATPPPVDRTR